MREWSMVYKCHNTVEHPQCKILAIQAKEQDLTPLHHIVITVEKIISCIEPKTIPQLETTRNHN